MTDRPTVLFVCVHNAGRSQMAAGYLRHLAGDRVDVLSAGSEPADQVNPIAVRAMAEEGIDITGAAPTVISTDAVRTSDVVITMGCGDACPILPGKRYEDWKLEDPPVTASRTCDPSATTSSHASSACSRSFLRPTPELRPPCGELLPRPPENPVETGRTGVTLQV